MPLVENPPPCWAIRGQLLSLLPWDRSRLQQGKFKLNINNKMVSASKNNIALEETALSHLEILKERLD